MIANVGRNLNIESQQDSDTYHSKQDSAEFSASVCVPPFCYGTTVEASANVAKANTDSTYESVKEQSGLYAGKGGFDVTVKGNTDLKGAVIASAAEPDKNRLVTVTGKSAALYSSTPVPGTMASRYITRRGNGHAIIKVTHGATRSAMA